MPSSRSMPTREHRILLATARERRLVDVDWQAMAACRQHDPDLFFPEAAEPAGRALEICAGCPVKAPCLAAALDAGEAEGIWGQTTADDRRVLRPHWVTSKAGRR